MAYDRFAQCETGASLIPNSTELAAIERCQQANETTYCWPPNGTRICAPAEDIPFYWPTGYYKPGTKLSLEWELFSKIIIYRNNTGYQTQDFTPYMYNTHGFPIPGKPNQRRIKMYFNESKIGEESYTVHDLQELTMVKTVDFPSETSARATARATATRRPSSLNDSEEIEAATRKMLAIVLPISLFVLALLIFCCCRACCCAKKPRTRQERDAELAARQLTVAPAEPRTPVVGNGPGQIRTLDPAADPSWRPPAEEQLPPYQKEAPPRYTP